MQLTLRIEAQLPSVMTGGRGGFRGKEPLIYHELESIQQVS